VITPWVDQPNRFVTVVSSQDTSENQLKLGLKKGNVFMKDIKLFKNGKIELTTNDDEKMGDVVVGHFPQKTVHIKVESLQLGHLVRFIQRPIPTNPPPADQVQLLTQYIKDEKYRTDGSVFERDVTITENNSFVRVEVCAPPSVGETECSNIDKVIGLSNPIYFVENEPIHSFLPEKRVFSCAGGNKGNLNCDTLGRINSVDFDILKNSWSPSGPPPAAGVGQHTADLNSDDKVDEIDMTTLMRNWTL